MDQYKRAAEGLNSFTLQHMIRGMEKYVSKYPNDSISLKEALEVYEAELTKRITSHGRVMRCG